MTARYLVVWRCYAYSAGRWAGVTGVVMDLMSRRILVTRSKNPDNTLTPSFLMGSTGARKTYKNWFFDFRLGGANTVAIFFVTR
ncbi:MAG: hypothetical protein U5M23_03140 [Marinagarivorans sp.]|nr:hypothetical protein [Marinagarivorans sp.]